MKKIITPLIACFFCGGASFAEGDAVNLDRIKESIRASVTEYSNLTGEFKSVQIRDGEKTLIDEVEFCIVPDGSWFKRNEHDDRLHVYGFNGEEYFARHADAVTLLKKRPHSKSWSIGNHLHTITPSLGVVNNDQVSLHEALSGEGGFNLNLGNNKNGEPVLTLNRKGGITPAGYAKIEEYRMTFSKDGRRLLSKSLIANLKKDGKTIFVPISQNEFSYSPKNTSSLPDVVTNIVPDIKNSVANAHTSHEEALSGMKEAVRRIYTFKNVSIGEVPENTKNKYALKKGDGVLDLPNDGNFYKID